jgi:hypothetical protein
MQPLPAHPVTTLCSVKAKPLSPTAGHCMQQTFPAVATTNRPVKAKPLSPTAGGRAAARLHRRSYSFSPTYCLTKAFLTGTARPPQEPSLVVRCFPVAPWWTPSRSNSIEGCRSFPTAIGPTVPPAFLNWSCAHFFRLHLKPAVPELFGQPFRDAPPQPINPNSLDAEAGFEPAISRL